MPSSCMRTEVGMVQASEAYIVFSLQRTFFGQYETRLNKYIRHYEGLSYDTGNLHNKHQRAKRALSHEDKHLHLQFHAHGSDIDPVGDYGRDNSAECFGNELSLLYHPLSPLTFLDLIQHTETTSAPDCCRPGKACGLGSRIVR
ncbi:hypothetical protein P4O66_004407 [Electrophorus voltai]|uniref:Uncharacterized protein n=1 Tax=Electrophorus voltai TaxID=2609070 RepID=A0AAD8ZMF5_9TELE|nr:hypothetical protein P4O66_004407 [Electrophorus voltai]